MRHEEEQLLSDQDLGVSSEVTVRRRPVKKVRYSEDQIKRVRTALNLVKILKIVGVSLVLMFTLLGVYFSTVFWYSQGGFGLILIGLGVAVYFLVFRRVARAIERSIPPDLKEILKKEEPMQTHALYVLTGLLLQLTPGEVWDAAKNFIWILLFVTVILLALIWLLSGSVLTQLGISYVTNIKQILVTTVMSLIIILLIVLWLDPQNPFLVNILDNAFRKLIETGFNWASGGGGG